MKLFLNAHLALARRVLMRPSLDYGELSSELSNDGWVSRSLDAAILQVILSEKGNALWLRSSPFFRQFDDDSEAALSAYLEVLLS